MVVAVADSRFTSDVDGDDLGFTSIFVVEWWVVGRKMQEPSIWLATRVAVFELGSWPVTTTSARFRCQPHYAQRQVHTLRGNANAKNT